MSTSATYTLPTASASTLGGIKVGTGLTISGGTLSATGVGALATLTSPPPLSNWTWVNQSTGTAADNSNGIFLTDTTVTATDSLRCLVVNAVSPPYTYTACAMVTPMFTDFCSAGFLFRESGSGKLQLLSIQHNSTVKLFVYNFLSATTSVGSTVPFTSGQVNPVPIWFQIIDDNISRKMNVSTDGINYVLMYSVARTTFITADQVGFFVSSLAQIAGLQLLSWKQT